MDQLEVEIGCGLLIRGALPPRVDGEFRRLFTLENPAWLSAKKYGRYCRDIPRKLSFVEKPESGGLAVPRGAAGRVLALLAREKVPHVVLDRTRSLAPVELSFTGTLRPHQERAAAAALSRRFSVIQLPTGAGKTVVALSCIASRGQPAAIVVHTKELLYQWRDRAAQFLNLSPDRIGQVGDGRCEIAPEVTICLVNSLYTRAREVGARIGHLIVDECHHVPSRTFTHAVSGFDCRFMLGLSATPFRRDGLTSLIHFYVGDQVFDIRPRELQDRGQILSARLRVRHTRFDYPFRDDYHQMMEALCADESRNQAIAGDVAAWAARGPGPALVVSERKAHCMDLAARIRALGPRTAVLTGDTPGPERREAVAAANAREIDVLVATLQLVGEGFDCPELSALFLATPMKFSGRVLQVVGRILRTALGKGPATVFDYADAPGVLKASFAARRKVYRQLGVTDDPGEAPGPGRKIWL